MKYLIDTHIFIWWSVGNIRLSKKAIAVLLNSTNEIYVSAVTAWEIELKQIKGSLKLSRTFEDYFIPSGFEELPVRFSHTAVLKKLPSIHKDPFDRLLIAQAKSEKLTLITADPKIRKYPVKTLF